MDTNWGLYALGAVAVAAMLSWAPGRLRLSRAKHRSLTGHARISRRLAGLVPFYSYGEHEFFGSDGAPEDVAASRRAALARLARDYRDDHPNAVALGERLESGVSDVAFTNAYRVPFQYRDYLREHLRVASFVEESADVRIKDTDGNWSYDLTGSYGVNVFGYDFYKDCIDAGAARVRALGPVLGAYHPIIEENVRRLREISKLDEVSFHMSGTEAVMQAVRLAQYHTRRPNVVLFCGAYHGWWDGVQPGVGNPRRVTDVYTLADMSERSLEVLRTRSDVACVLVNPLQALHPNRAAPGDGSLFDSSRSARFDRAAYADWLGRLREVCTERGIALIFDEVFLGFRLARGGAQEYFGVRADLVTYGKTLGGGLPVGVLCGAHRFMKRFRDDRPTDVCFARGTFNSHPYVLGAMNEFLRRLDSPAIAATYERLDERWDSRAAALNARLEAAGLPVRVANLVSVWTILYTQPSRYNWMFQFYLRAEGLALSWVGSGRLIFSHNYSDVDFAAVAERFLRAAETMRADGWWWSAPALTNKAIRRQILKEIVRARFGRRAEAAAPAALVNPRV
jgi:glutamate-1-semialdehyde 2,1-aminomutase